MSDREGHVGSGSADDDLSLPKATVAKMITGEYRSHKSPMAGTRYSSTCPPRAAELLPNEVTCAKETRDLVIECCVEFIHLISSEANEICEQESKKTIAPEHIIGALKRLGFDSFTSEVEDVLKDHKQQQKDREKKADKIKDSGLTPEELQAKQEELFALSRAKFAQPQQQP
ncbi:TATA binding protein-associated phosphoprotein [Butyriboletus roseoflavus]|nr:TATA binding protein-associated phosphoprotein [Butyriboletus roseoflavus]